MSNLNLKTWISLGLATGVVMLLIFYPIPQGGDTVTYIAIGKNLLAGKGFTEDGIIPTAQVPPLYPLILAAAVRIAPIHYVLLVHLFQFALLGLIAAFTYFLARRFFDVSRAWAAATGALVLIWPYFLLYGSLLLTEVPYILFLIGGVASFLVLVKHGRLRAAILAGVCFGLALLIRPAVLFLPVWLALAALVVPGWRTRRHLAGYVLTLVLFALVQAPWLIRNERVFGTPLPTTNIGIIVWKGLNIADWKRISVQGVPGQPGLNEQQSSVDLIGKAAAVAKQNPVAVARGLVRKSILFWNPGAGGSYAAYVEVAQGFGKIGLAIYRVAFFVILALAALGLTLWRRREGWILAAVILHFWLLHTVLFPYPRYTLPVMPLVFVLAATALAAMTKSERRELSLSTERGSPPKDLAVSVVIPAHNEGLTIRSVIADLLAFLPNLTARFEVVVVDDGSTDNTSEALAAFRDQIRVLRHSFPRGYGAAIKHGAAAAAYPYLVFFDADGQHRADELAGLFGAMNGADMVIGARTGGGEAGWQRKWGKAIIRSVVEFLVRARVPDFNSGFRIIKKETFARYAHLFPNGFSLSTTSTVALLHEGHEVRFVPIVSAPRTQGESTVRVGDGFKTVYTATRLVLLFAPLRVLVPVAATLFALFLGFFVYDLAHLDVSNTAVALLLGSIIFFFFGALMDLVTTILRERT